MATRDQAVFLDTFLGLQRALKRKAYNSDSDSSIDQSTNRGNKLKRRARFVRQGRLGASDGLSVFAESIEHAGYRREIICHNPPLVDDEGYEINSDDDDVIQVQEAEANAAEENPYAGIRLERILAPLTAVTDLPSHPTLSRPFVSKALTELASQGCNWMHKENAALWEVKPLLTKFCGDHIWVDCALMVTPEDGDLFDDSFVARLAAAQAGSAKSVTAATTATSGDEVGLENGTATEEHPFTGAGIDVPDALIDDVLAANAGESKPVNGTQATAPNTNGITIDSHQALVRADENNPVNTNNEEGDNDNANSDGDDSDDDGRGFIHPLYLAPRSAHPEPNLGLPEGEAENVRRLLQLWVQKQEEVARGTRKLHEGLLRADRLRKTVFLWSKAEANRDLSDGEDWYDREAWGLAEDLKKGHDDEEEDLQQPHKKTRNRK